MSKARAGRGATLKIDTEVIAEHITIGAVELSAETIDVTNSDSNGYKETIAGLKEGGDCEVSGNYVSADDGQAALLAAFDSGAVVAVEIDYPKLSTETTGPKFTFNATVTKCSPVGEVNQSDQLKFKATFKISGKPTFTDAVAGA